MHSCIATLLFILASLSSARYLDRYTTESWHTRDMERVDGCLKTSVGMWFWPGAAAYVFFNNPSDLSFTYAIATSYDVYYPQTLSHLLHAHNYTIRSKYDVQDSELCGWWYAGTARVDGRHHGNILWKYSDLRRKPDVPDFGNFRSWEASSRDHIPPHLSTTPNDATFNFVRDILVENVPNADIYYNWATLWSCASGILGMLALQLALKCWTDHEMRKQDSESSSDIELDEIRVHSLSGSSMQRMDMDDYVKTPSFAIEITKPDAASPIPSRTASTIADPPPIYSVDGAGR
ncbi:hypothetical protein BU25DRAFT_257457 [Macroventuria anomochaeta]|uniref:Uncharacterized protein n=1 Tax=Macroventuria anomochaeta TaxID=301207 RepID=A0ACB6S818_9PLEO|nr:uncharacterized protein BU25DRAFT_257457 [Macroventuria anomochaeta]KAF2630410.1 hypothetical protein BU25DRAFT_257457 [Macroventuria anomochaeta]